MKPNIKYSFHIGERCQSHSFLKKNGLISTYTPFAGTYISFDNSIKFINNNFEDYLNNIACFTLMKYDINDVNIINKNKEYNNVEKLLSKCKFDFFYKENFYFGHPYSINLGYTDLNNFKIDDMYNWKSFCVMPNMNYATDSQIEKHTRRKNRLLDVLHNKKYEHILLIYQTKLCKYINYKSVIEETIKIYNLKYNLFFIIPVYFDNYNDEFEEEVITNKNITFYLIKFPSLEYQLKNYPSDDNKVKWNKSQYNKIKYKISEIYDLNIIILK